MNRQILTNTFFADLDEFILMQIEAYTYVDKNTAKTGHQVIGTTKSGIKVILYDEKQSGEPTKCYSWITEHWLNTPKKGIL